MKSEFCAELWHPDPSYSFPRGLSSLLLYFRCLFMFVNPLFLKSNHEQMLERQGSGDIMPLLGVPGSACLPLAWAPALGRSGQVPAGTLAPSPPCCRQSNKLTLTKERLPATDSDLGICLPSLL